jgi:hypothetical protein
VKTGIERFDDEGEGRLALIGLVLVFGLIGLAVLFVF